MGVAAAAAEAGDPVGHNIMQYSDLKHHVESAVVTNASCMD